MGSLKEVELRGEAKRVLRDLMLLSARDRNKIIAIIVGNESSTTSEGISQEGVEFYCLLCKWAKKIHGHVLPPIKGLARDKLARMYLNNLSSEVIRGIDTNALETRYAKQRTLQILDLCAEAIVAGIPPPIVGRRGLYAQRLLEGGLHALDSSFPDYRENRLLHALIYHLEEKRR